MGGYKVLQDLAETPKSNEVSFPRKQESMLTCYVDLLNGFPLSRE